MSVRKEAAQARDASLTDRTHPRSWLGFLHLYGWLGVPMLLAFVLSAAWTAMLAIIQVAPTSVANSLMGTAEFDFGEFWLLSRPDTRIAVLAAITLSIFSLGYCFLALAMIFPEKLVGEPCATRWLSTKSVRVRSLVIAVRKTAKVADTNAPVTHSPWRRLYFWLTRLGSWLDANRDSAVLTLPKLILQTTTLLTYLREGFPLTVIFSYSCLLLINWLCSAYRSAYKRPDPRMVATRLFQRHVCSCVIDTLGRSWTHLMLLVSFDLFFAVFAQFHVLVYAYSNFAFDREVFATRIDAFSPEEFDRTARLFADPTEISLFTFAFEHMQLASPSRLLIKAVLNAFAIVRWYFVIEHLSQHRHSFTTGTHLDRPTEGQDRQNRSSNARKRLRLACRMLLVLAICSAGAGIFVYSIVAVTSSCRVCRPYTQCKVASYRWNVGEDHCPCIVFADRDTALTTIADWEDPPHATDGLKLLAHSGHLKIVQIINRQVPYFPPELRNCRGLEQLILIYTKTIAIPDWAKEFGNLEYVHIEGDVTAKQLTYIPRDLFENMSRLKFLHLGCLLSLPLVPDLQYLTRLEYLALAMLHEVSEIPPLDQLARLKKLSLVDNARMSRLPRLSALHSLSTIALSYRTPVCCNGFISGTCNLEAFSCLDRRAQGEHLVECTSDRILPRDLEVLTSTDGIVCPPDLPFDLKGVKPTLESTDLACGGVMHKQCWIEGVPGICFPARMQPVSCQIDPDYTKMRRLQIERNVGVSCDPTVESWLGCNPH